MVPFLSTAEAGRLAGCTPDAIRAAAREGRLKPAAMTGSGIRLFTREGVLVWASKRTKRRRAAATGADE